MCCVSLCFTNPYVSYLNQGNKDLKMINLVMLKFSVSLWYKVLEDLSLIMALFLCIDSTTGS